MTLFIITLLIGLLAGLILGMLGGGSGLALVPGISFLLLNYYPAIPHDMVMQFAIGDTFLVTLLFGGFTTYTQHRRGLILWGHFRKLILSIILGTIVGNLITHALPSHVLRIIFGLLVLLLGIRMLFKNDVSTLPTPWPRPFFIFCAGLFFGLVCGALGIAPFVVPYLKRYGVSMHQAIATSTACGVLFALVGGITAALGGWHTTLSIPHTIGYIYLPLIIPLFLGCVIASEIGARIAHKLSAEVLKRFYCSLLFVVGIKMLL